MADFRAAMIEKAFRTVPGIAYNQTLEEFSRQTTASDTKPLLYETVMPEEGPWDLFRDKTYPPFARYMKWRSINPEDPQGVIVAVFFKESCHFLAGREFLRLLCELEELTPAALHVKILQWLAPLKALGEVA